MEGSVSLCLFVSGLIGPKPGRGLIRQVLEGGHDVDKDPAVAVSMRSASQQQPGHGFAKAEARGS